MMPVTRAVALLVPCLLVAATGTAVAGKPWPPREPSHEPNPAHQLRSPVTTWPAEPEAARAARRGALHRRARRTCATRRPTRRRRVARRRKSSPRRPPPRAIRSRSPRWRGSAAAAIPTTRARGGTYGLLASSPACTACPGAPEPPVDKGDLTSKRLLDPDVNLAVGAALLEMWNATHKEIDAAFGGGLHRSGVAHFTWGDVVRSSGQEDLILTARRRMIGNYLGNKDVPRLAPYIGLNIVSPLEATPRVAPSGPGDDRSGGARRHAGLDIVGHARRAGARDRRRHRDLHGHQQPDQVAHERHPAREDRPLQAPPHGRRRHLRLHRARARAQARRLLLHAPRQVQRRRARSR